MQPDHILPSPILMPAKTVRGLGLGSEFSRDAA
jgi:hypothetical protein